MIHWFDTPYKGTNKESGFEVVILGLLYPGGTDLQAICADEEGVMRVYPHDHIVLDWRYTRERGWFGVDEQVEE